MIRPSKRLGAASAFAFAIVAGLAIPRVLAGPQTRDAGGSGPAADGSAAIAGIVLASDGRGSTTPGRRVIVALTSPALPVIRTTITDDRGRFTFDRLPAGRYMVTATKPAYLKGAFGATRPGRPGAPVILAEGAHVSDMTITMALGAVIAGTVRDSSGTPAFGLTISAFRVLPDGSLTSAGTAMSDDRGGYRFFGLTAGDYLVSASLGNGTGLGEIGEMSGDDIDRVFARLRARPSQTNTSIGRSSTNDNLAGAPRTTPVTATSNFAPVYFPRAFSTADATKVHVEFGDERLGVDIVLDRVRSAMVDGAITGLPADIGVIVTMTAAGPVARAILGGPALKPRGRGDGPFEFSNVTPGHYTITARTATGVTPALWGRADVDIDGADVHGVPIEMRPVKHFAGRIVFDGTRLAPPSDLSTIDVSLQDAAPGPGGGRAGGAGAASAGGRTTDARGNFDVDNIVPGVYRVATTLAPDPSGWWLRSAIVNGSDVLDAPLEIGATTPLAGAVLTFSDRHTVLSGALEAPAGRQAADYVIVVFPEDRAWWLPRARRIQTARPGTDGSFLLRDLPPGSYRLAAVTDLFPDDLIDPTFFAALLPASVPVTLGEGESKAQALRIR